MLSFKSHPSVRAIVARVLFAGVLFSAPLCAQNFVFDNGDVILGFQATDGQGATQNIFFNLGKTTALRDNPGGGVVADLGPALAQVFGNDWFDRSNIHFGVYGNLNYQAISGIGSKAAVDGDPSRTTYVSARTDTPGNAIKWTGYVSSGLGTAGLNFSGLEGILTVLPVGPGGVGILDQVENPVEWNNSWTAWNPTPGAAFGIFAGGIQNHFGQEVNEVYVDIQRILATNTGAAPTGTVGTGDYIATLGISSSGQVRLFVADVDPTPTPTPSPTPDPTPTPSPTPTPDPTPEESPTPDPSPTPEESPSPSPSPTSTPTPAPVVVEVGGGFQGLIGNLGPMNPSSDTDSIVDEFQTVLGGATLKVNPKRAFTITVTVEGQQYKGKGAFDNDGSFVGEVTGKAGVLPLTLDMISPNEATAFFRGTCGTNDILLGKAVYNSKNPFPVTNAVGNLLLGAPLPETPDNLEGVGTASLGMNKNGVAKLAGMLPDGTKYTASIPVWGATGEAGENLLLVFINLYKGQGYVGGWLSEIEETDSDFSGIWQWSSPASSGKTPRFTEAFAAQLEPALARNPALAKGTPLVSWTQGMVSLEDVQMPSGLNASVTYLPNNKLVFGEDAADAKPKIKVNAKAALVSGTFVHPVTGKPVKVFGAFNRKTEKAYGFYLTPSASGLVEMAEIN